MNTSLLSLKKLRYRPLPHLLRPNVTIARIADTESTVLREIDPALASGCKRQQSARELALLSSKYGFLDLIFQEPPHLLKKADHPRAWTPRELNFMGARASATGEDPACFQTMIDGIDGSRCWLRLFLFGQPAMDAIKRVFEHYSMHAQPTWRPPSVESTMFRMERALSRLANCVDGRFPLTFTIRKRMPHKLRRYLAGNTLLFVNQASFGIEAPRSPRSFLFLLSILFFVPQPPGFQLQLHEPATLKIFNCESVSFPEPESPAESAGAGV